MDDGLPGSFIARRLAASNTLVRGKALRSLAQWFASHRDVTDGELRLIWKGLFYCVWHADKQDVQLELINYLASFVTDLETALSIRYFGTFLVTIRREWSGIDFLRLDKFYLLIRRFMNHFFLLMKKNSWHVEVTNTLMETLTDKTLLAVDKYEAFGVNYHITEIFLAELKGFLPVTLETMDLLFKPFLSILQRSPNKVYLAKIKSNVFTLLLQNGRKLLHRKKAGSSDDCNDDIANLGSIALVMGFAKKFFELASSTDTLQASRKFLFSLHEDFVKLEKGVEMAGVCLSELQVPSNKSEKADVELGHGNVMAEKPPKKKKKIRGAYGEKGLSSDVKLVNDGDESSTILAMENASDLADESSKKSKKCKRSSKEKSKTKSRGFSASKPDERSTMMEDNEKNVDTVAQSNGSVTEGEGAITFDAAVVSNLQKEFEKVAAEVGLNIDAVLCPIPTGPVDGIKTKKRKRVKSVDDGLSEKLVSLSERSNDEEPLTANGIEKSGERSIKRVRFAMKNNLVWKPHNPLPPQSLRLPPSATPRGSALKKGVPPGPVNETPATKKKARQKAGPLKMGRRSPKSLTASVKRPRKLKASPV